MFKYNHVGTGFFQASHKYDLKILKGHTMLYYKFLINDIITSILERIRRNTGEESRIHQWQLLYKQNGKPFKYWANKKLLIAVAL